MYLPNICQNITISAQWFIFINFRAVITNTVFSIPSHSNDVSITMQYHDYNLKRSARTKSLFTLWYLPTCHPTGILFRRVCNLKSNSYRWINTGIGVYMTINFPNFLRINMYLGSSTPTTSPHLIVRQMHPSRVALDNPQADFDG